MTPHSQLPPLVASYETAFKSPVSKAVLDLGRLKVLQEVHLAAQRSSFTCAGQDSE